MTYAFIFGYNAITLCVNTLETLTLFVKQFNLVTNFVTQIPGTIIIRFRFEILFDYILVLCERALETETRVATFDKYMKHDWSL